MQVFFPLQSQASEAMTAPIETAIEIATEHDLGKWEYTRNSMKLAEGPNGRGFTLNTHGLEKVKMGKKGLTGEIMWLDEIQDIQLWRIVKVVAPMRARTGGMLICSGTAEDHVGMEKIRHYFEDYNEREYYINTLRDAVDRGDITEKEYWDVVHDYEEGEDDPEFLKEQMCRTDLPVRGAVLKDWRMDFVHNEEEFSKGQISREVLAMDLGHDGYALTHCTVYENHTALLRQGWKFHEYTDQVIEAIKKEPVPDMPDKCYGDIPEYFTYIIVPPDAKQDRVTTPENDAKQWADSKLSKHIVTCRRDTGGVPGMFSGVNKRINNYKISMNFNDDFLRECKAAHWKKDQYGNITDKIDKDGTDHAADCIRYLVYMLSTTLKMWPERISAGRKKKDLMEYIFEDTPDDLEKYTYKVPQNPRDKWKRKDKGKVHGINLKPSLNN